MKGVSKCACTYPCSHGPTGAHMLGVVCCVQADECSGEQLRAPAGACGAGVLLCPAGHAAAVQRRGIVLRRQDQRQRRRRRYFRGSPGAHTLASACATRLPLLWRYGAAGQSWQRLANPLLIRLQCCQQRVRPSSAPLLHSTGNQCSAHEQQLGGGGSWREATRRAGRAGGAGAGRVVLGIGSRGGAVGRSGQPICAPASTAHDSVWRPGCCSVHTGRQRGGQLQRRGRGGGGGRGCGCEGGHGVGAGGKPRADAAMRGAAAGGAGGHDGARGEQGEGQGGRR